MIEFDTTEPAVASVQSSCNALDSFTPDEWREQITSCPDFGPIYLYLTNKIIPDDDARAHKLLLQIDEYAIIDGVLYHIFTPRTKGFNRESCVIRQRCIPRNLRSQVATEFHDRLAHVGFERLYNTIRSRFYFYDRLL